MSTLCQLHENKMIILYSLMYNLYALMSIIIKGKISNKRSDLYES